VSLRFRTAIVGYALRHLCTGGAVLAVMERTRAGLAALPTRFGRPLPACTLRDRALRKCEDADDRRHTFQERPHSLSMRERGQGVKCEHSAPPE
jgi:hypothetical protein